MVVQTRIIEATQDVERGPNWGKFLVGRLDREWTRTSRVDTGRLLLSTGCGWSRSHLWVLDLQTGEGAYFWPAGSARADLRSHQIHVCVLFEPFLEWLYAQDVTDLSGLPELVELPAAAAGLYGYRRAGQHGTSPDLARVV